MPKVNPSQITEVFDPKTDTKRREPENPLPHDPSRTETGRSDHLHAVVVKNRPGISPPNPEREPV